METSDKKEAYLEKLEAQLREWDGMWEVLKARLAKKRADLNLGRIELLEKLEATHGEGREKLAELRRSVEQNWESFRTEAEELLGLLDKGMAVVGDRLKAWQRQEGGAKKEEP